MGAACRLAAEAPVKPKHMMLHSLSLEAHLHGLDELEDERPIVWLFAVLSRDALDQAMLLRVAR